MQNTKSSKQFFEKAKTCIPGGVNSPVRAFNSVGGIPRFIRSAKGPFLYDVDGNEYVDTICSWGPAIVGHANETVISAIRESMNLGLSFGAPTEGETRLAEIIKKHLPATDMVRLTSSGTEATMSAIRLARGYTNKTKIIKFEGCYHGHVDSLLVKAGSGLLTLGNPTSGGVPDSFAAETIVLPYNNLEKLNDCFNLLGNKIAGVIIEPIAGNMNLVKPDQDFLKCLREQCTKYNSVLIFDEVMTGFRVSMGGAQEIYGIDPDLTTLGKVIGGGMPMGAVTGKKQIMEYLAPIGPVYQAGTLSGNPVAVAAGIATLTIVTKKDFFPKLTKITSEFTRELEKIAKENNIRSFCCDSVGGMFGIYFRQTIPKTFEDIMDSDVNFFKIFFHEMLANGVYLAPSPYEAGFLSVSHEGEAITKILTAAESSFKSINAKKNK